MDALSLINAGFIGVLVGLAGHALTPARRAVTWLLPAAVGAGGAVFGTIAVWLVDHRTAVFTPVGLARQTLFAAVAVAVAVARTNRRRHASPVEPQ